MLIQVVGTGSTGKLFECIVYSESYEETIVNRWIRQCHQGREAKEKYRQGANLKL